MDIGTRVDAAISGGSIAEGAGRTRAARVNDAKRGSRTSGGLANVPSRALRRSSTIDGAANLKAGTIKAAVAGGALNVGTQRNGGLGAQEGDERKEQKRDSH